MEGFQDLLASGNKKLLETCRTAIESYQIYHKEIILSLKLPYSNGPVEAINNQLKVIKRITYGFRNFVNFKSGFFEQKELF